MFFNLSEVVSFESVAYAMALLFQRRLYIIQQVLLLFCCYECVKIFHFVLVGDFLCLNEWFYDAFSYIYIIQQLIAIPRLASHRV